MRTRNVLRSWWQVTAGLIPGQPMEEYTRRWSVTEAQMEAIKGGDKQENYRYMDAAGAALNYAASLFDPNRVNWVALEWVWL